MKIIVENASSLTFTYELIMNHSTSSYIGGETFLALFIVTNTLSIAAGIIYCVPGYFETFIGFDWFYPGNLDLLIQFIWFCIYNILFNNFNLTYFLDIWLHIPIVDVEFFSNELDLIYCLFGFMTT